MAGLEMHAHMKVRPGQWEGFQRQAAECIRLTQENDTRTLRYDWFLSGDGTECEAHEAYVDSEGMLEHNAHVSEARDKLFAEFAEDHFMTFYGQVSPELAGLLEKLQKAGHVRYKLFSFVQGLDSPARV